MLGLDDSDDDTFSASSFGDSTGNRLGSLFGQSDAKSQASLKYTQKKQPSLTTSSLSNHQAASQQPPPAPTVLHATAIHLYQYQSQTSKFEPVGKVGCAVLGTPANNGASATYQLLCYRATKDYVCQATIPTNFSFTIQNGQYGSFYDNNQQLWSLLFQTPDEAFHFGIFVAIAKYATQINTVSQNSMEISSVNMNEQATASALTENDEDAVRVGSRVAVKYTGWLLSAESAVNYKLGKSFDSNASSDKLFRFKVDAGEVIKGWDKGLIGMKAGGRRFLVIPPSLAYGEAGRPPVIPQNAALCFQIEVVKVRNSSSSSTASSSGSISPQIQPTIVTKLHAEQPIVSQKQVSSKKRMKNKLQAFGTPSPFMIGNYMVNNNDDSGDDEDILSTASSDHSSSHMSVSSPVVQHQVTTPTIQPVQPVQPAQPVQSAVEQTVKVDPQMELLQQQIASLQAMLQQSSKPSTPQADSAESESKSKKKKKYRKKKQDSSSSEASDEEPVAADSKKETIKAATPTVDSDQVAKLMERLEFISAKVEDIHQVQAKQFRSELEDDEHKNEKLMSGTVLIANLQHVLQQNDQLKLEIAAERDNVDSLVEKVSQLRKRNEKYAKESYQSAQEQENEHLVSQLDLAKKQLTDLKRKCKRLEDQVETERETASQTQSEHDNQIKQLKKQLEEAKVQAREREVQLQNDFLEQKKNYEEQIKQYSHESQNSEVERSQREQQLQTLLQQTQTKLSNTSSELLKVQSELTHVQGELQERDSSLLQKQSRINLLETKNASLAKRVDDLESESGEVSDQVRESEKNISNLSRQLEQLKTALQEKHAELLESQEELSQANEQHEETLGNLREAFKSRLQEYQTTQLQESVSETLQQALRWMVRNVYSTMKDSALQGQVEKRYKGQKILSALAGVLKHYMVLLIENVDEGVDIDEIEVEQPESVELSDDEGEQSGQEEENIEEAAEEAEEPVSQAVDQQEEVEQEAVESIEQEEEPEQEETEQEVEPIEQEHVVEDEEEEVPEETQEQEDQITEDDLAQPETVEQPEEQPEDEGIEAAEEAEVEEQEIGESAHEQEDEEQEEKEEIGEEHAENEEEQQPVESSISLEQDEEEVEHTNEEENVPSDVNASEEVYSEEEQHVEQEESTVGVEDDTNQYTEDIESEPVDSAVEESPLKNDEDESIPVESQQNVVGGFAFGLRALLLSKPQEDENEQGEEKEVEEDNVQDETNEPSPREEQQPNEEEDRDEINEEEENYSNEEVDNDATPSEEHNNEEIVSEEAANEEIVSEEQEEQETDLNNEPEQSQPLNISTEVITPQTNNTSKPNTPSKLFSYSDDEDDIPVPFAPKVVEPTAEDLQKQEQLQKAKKASTSKLFMDDDDDFW